MLLPHWRMWPGKQVLITSLSLPADVTLEKLPNIARLHFPLPVAEIITVPGCCRTHSFPFVSGISDYQRAVRRKTDKEQALIHLSVRNSNLFLTKKGGKNNPDRGCSLAFPAA